MLVQTPPTMKQGESANVLVRIAGNNHPDLVAKLSEDLPGPGNRVLDDLKVEEYMSVKLDGEGAFMVAKGATAEDQRIDPNDYSEWDFKITALKEGPHELRLFVGVRLLVTGRHDEYSFKPKYTRPILVEVVRGYGAWQFWRRNSTWILSTIGEISGAIVAR